MTFRIFVHPSLFEKVPAERKESIKSAIKGLTNPFPDSNGDKKELKETRIITYRLRIGDYRVFYQIDEKENKIYVFDILTAEQAHKKYGRM
jgi:mRNA-degrading endonuclease RelE of RelBE toxin-antitoxin system